MRSLEDLIIGSSCTIWSPLSTFLIFLLAFCYVTHSWGIYLLRVQEQRVFFLISFSLSISRFTIIPSAHVARVIKAACDHLTLLEWGPWDRKDIMQKRLLIFSFQSVCLIGNENIRAFILALFQSCTTHGGTLAHFINYKPIFAVRSTVSLQALGFLCFYPLQKHKTKVEQCSYPPNMIKTMRDTWWSWGFSLNLCLPACRHDAPLNYCI